MGGGGGSSGARGSHHAVSAVPPLTPLVSVPLVPPSHLLMTGSAASAAVPVGGEGSPVSSVFENVSAALSVGGGEGSTVAAASTVGGEGGRGGSSGARGSHHAVSAVAPPTPLVSVPLAPPSHSTSGSAAAFLQMMAMLNPMAMQFATQYFGAPHPYTVAPTPVVSSTITPIVSATTAPTASPSAAPSVPVTTSM